MTVPSRSDARVQRRTSSQPSQITSGLSRCASRSPVGVGVAVPRRLRRRSGRPARRGANCGPTRSNSARLCRCSWRCPLCACVLGCLWGKEASRSRRPSRPTPSKTPTSAASPSRRRTSRSTTPRKARRSRSSRPEFAEKRAVGRASGGVSLPRRGRHRARRQSRLRLHGCIRVRPRPHILDGLEKRRDTAYTTRRRALKTLTSVGPVVVAPSEPMCSE